jgi:hypothetical protein
MYAKARQTKLPDRSLSVHFRAILPLKHYSYHMLYQSSVQPAPGRTTLEECATNRAQQKNADGQSAQGRLSQINVNNGATMRRESLLSSVQSP